MAHWTLRILTYLALVSTSFASGAEAGVGDSSGSALSSFGGLSPAQKAQYNSFDSGDCWYDNGWNGPGWYQCGNEWNNGLGWVGPFGSTGFIGPAIRRHHRHGVGVLHPTAPRPVYRGYEPSRRLGAGAAPPSAGLHGGAPAFGGLGFRRFGHSGVHASPGLHPGAAPVYPGVVGGGVHGLGGVSHFHGGGAIGAPHIGAPASPGFTGGGFPCRWRDWSSPHRRAAPYPALPAAAVSIPAARLEFPTSARPPYPALLAAAVSIPAAGSELPTSARPSRLALLAAGFTALEGLEVSRAARRSDRAASDIAERPPSRGPPPPRRRLDA